MIQETVTSTSSDTLSYTCRLLNKKGIHARTAAQLVMCTQNFDAAVILCYKELCVNCHSILGLMMLGSKRGDILTFQATGKEAQEVLNALKVLIEDKFGEE